MTMTVACPSCQRRIRMPENLAGRQVKCPGCDAPFIVPSASSAPSPEPETEPLPVAFVEEAAPPGSTGNPGPVPVAHAARSPAGNSVQDFLTFRVLITPVVIQVVCWIGVGLAVLGSVYLIVQGASVMTIRGGGATGFVLVLLGLFSLVLGPLAVRVNCEIIVVFFRMNETLTDLKHLAEKQRQGND